MTAPARVLLVEVINADQFPGQIRRDLPFVAGFLAAHGAHVRWLRFGLATTNQLQHGRDEVTFDADELVRLQTALDEHAATRMLGTHALAPEQRSRLLQARPGLTVEVLPPSPGDELVPGATFRPEDGLTGTAWRPVYTWEVANAGAAAHDNVALFLCSYCGYARPLAENPCYRDLVAEGLPLADGCAFCGNAAGSRAATPAAWLRRQVQALAADRGVARAPKALLCEHLEGRRALGALTGALADTGLVQATTLHFGVRTDTLARLEPLLRAWLGASPDARLGVYATGLESFVEADLVRFHKGTTPADGLRAIALLRGLRRDFPGRFASTGLTMILFTPWTTPADLAANLRQVQDLDLADEIGNLFAARLRLHPGRAITELARRQGFLVDDEPDPLLSLNRRKLFGTELAWRFADPRLEPLCRVYVRLDEAVAAAADPLSVQVRQALARAFGAPRRDWMTRKLELLLALVDEVATEPLPLAEADLLARALGRLLGPAPASGAEESAERAPSPLRLVFTPRRGRVPAVAFRLAPAASDPPAFRRVGALALSYEPGARADALARLTPLVEAAAARTPPPLDDAAAWQRRLGALLETFDLARAFRVEATAAQEPHD